jgi:transposase
MGMTSPPITPEQLAALPPEFRAILQAVIDHYEKRIAALEAELAAARKTPRNSSLPPSSEHPHAKPPAPKPKSPRKRGGQPGHTKHERALIPTEQCQQVVPVKPDRCRRCGRGLRGHDSRPLRHQVWDLPPIEPQVSEYQLHRLTCACGATTCAALPPGVSPSQAGPRLIALVTLLMGCFRQSKRRVALFLEQVLNQPCSPGWVVKLQNRGTAALRPCYDELAARLPGEKQLGIDETPNKQGPDKAWLWTLVATTFTCFAFRTTRAATVLTDLLGTTYEGVVNCDRAKMYFLLPRLQWCWAHLKRDFQALVDSGDGVKKRLGQDLLRPTRKMFHQWARARDGTLTKVGFQRLMKPIRHEIEALLLRGKFAGIGMADELWRHRERLWTFVDVEGIEPTNNASERALRHAVIWRKLSFGTQSEAGSRFVETILTVVETCRQQRRNVFAFLTIAITAHLHHQPAPSLTRA